MTMKKICIRVDGNEIIATGHIMRCLSIAQQIRDKGQDVIFVLADSRPVPMIAEREFEYHILNTLWNDMDMEIAPFSQFIKDQGVEVILLDSYYVTGKYLSVVSKLAKICYIDDLDRMVYPVHTLINYSLQCDRNYEERYRKEKLNTKFLLGAAYAPLRKEFFFEPYQVRETVKKVLITTGGTDQLNMTYKLLERFISNSSLSEIEYNVIVGRFNQNKDALIELATQYSNIVIHNDVSNMSYWMRTCDVAVSAAGTTTFELAACGIPSICFEVADNQEGAHLWQKGGYMFYAGNAYKEQTQCLENCQIQLKKLCNNRDLRISLSEKMQGLVDGLGTSRIAEYLIKANEEK